MACDFSPLAPAQARQVFQMQTSQAVTSKPSFPSHLYAQSQHTVVSGPRGGGGHEPRNPCTSITPGQSREPSLGAAPNLARGHSPALGGSSTASRFFLGVDEGGGTPWAQPVGLGVSLFDKSGLQSGRARVTRGQELLEVPTPESSRGGGDLHALLGAPFLQAWATVPPHLESHALGQRPGCPLKVPGETLQ